MDAILKRRSIRKYTDQEVTGSELERMLEAAMAAPSANNLRPAHYVVVRDRQVLETISKVHPYATMASRASAAIVVCADTGVQPDPGYYAQDCSASTMNILLQSTDLGIGSVWCGIHPSRNRVQAFIDLLGLPQGIVPFSLVLLGRPGEAKEPHSGVEEARVHVDRW